MYEFGEVNRYTVAGTCKSSILMCPVVRPGFFIGAELVKNFCSISLVFRPLMRTMDACFDVGELTATMVSAVLYWVLGISKYPALTLRALNPLQREGANNMVISF